MLRSLVIRVRRHAKSTRGLHAPATAAARRRSLHRRRRERRDLLPQLGQVGPLYLLLLGLVEEEEEDGLRLVLVLLEHSDVVGLRAHELDREGLGLRRRVRREKNCAGWLKIAPSCVWLRSGTLS